MKEQTMDQIGEDTNINSCFLDQSKCQFPTLPPYVFPLQIITAMVKTDYKMIRGVSLGTLYGVQIVIISVNCPLSAASVVPQQ